AHRFTANDGAGARASAGAVALLDTACPSVAPVPFDGSAAFVSAVTSGRYAAHPAGYLLPRMVRRDMHHTGITFHASQVAGFGGTRGNVAPGTPALSFGATSSQQRLIAEFVTPPVPFNGAAATAPAPAPAPAPVTTVIAN